MAAEALVVLLFVGFAVVAPLVLWALVQTEREDRTVMDREAAERAARRDTAEASAREKDGTRRGGSDRR